MHSPVSGTLTLLLAAASSLPAQKARPSTEPDTCLPASAPSSQATLSFQLPDSLGTIHLWPGALREPLGTNPHGAKFVLEDSTVVEVWVTEQSADWLSTSANVQTTGYRRCTTVRQGYPTSVVRVQFTKRDRAPVYTGIVHIVLDDHHTLNLAVTTATATSRDDALGIVGWLDLLPPSRGP